MSLLVSLFKRTLLPPLVLLAAIALLVEDIVWEAIKRVMARIAAWPLLAALERGMARLGPYPTLLLFVVPALVILPFKLAAVWMIASGRALSGLVLLVIAKSLGTAIGVRIFAVGKTQLMRIAWFAAFYGWIVRVKSRIYLAVMRHPVWIRTQAAAARMRSGLAARLRRLGWGQKGQISRRYDRLKAWAMGSQPPAASRP